MIKLVTYTDDRMTISATKCAQSAMKYGADAYSIWTPNDLPEFFKETMRDVLQHERGAGFYCWKPFVVMAEINKCADGDILVWCDAGNEWIGDMREAIKGMDQDILFFSNGWKHADWCKMDCFMEILNDLVSDALMDNKAIAFEIREAKQVQASTFIISVNQQTRKFIREWFAYSIKPGMIDNEPGVFKNLPSFQEHRWDQSILCCLQIKHGYRLHWFPTTTSGHLDRGDDRYPALLNHHRKRNHEWQN